MKRILAFLSIVLLAAAFQVQAANWHVSISNGKTRIRAHRELLSKIYGKLLKKQNRAT